MPLYVFPFLHPKLAQSHLGRSLPYYSFVSLKLVDRSPYFLTTPYVISCALATSCIAIIAFFFQTGFLGLFHLSILPQAETSSPPLINRPLSTPIMLWNPIKITFLVMFFSPSIAPISVHFLIN